MMGELSLRNGISSSDLGVRYGGFKQQRELLKEVIELKLVKRETSKVRVKGVLVHGPSGIGKTMAIESVLSEYQSVHKILISPKVLVQA